MKEREKNLWPTEKNETVDWINCRLFRVYERIEQHSRYIVSWIFMALVLLPIIIFATHSDGVDTKVHRIHLGATVVVAAANIQ